MGLEQRKNPRIPLKLHVECRGKSIMQSAQCYNLSAGGMFLATEKIEGPGSHLEILFEVGDGREKKIIQAEATVRWTRSTEGKCDDGTFLPPGMGVQFTKVFPFNGIKILEKMIEERRIG